MEVERDQYATFKLDAEKRVIELVWSAATSRMNEADFRRLITRFAELSEEHREHNLLVDVRTFGYWPATDFDDWRDANIIPRYNEAGVRKEAFFFPPGTATGEAPAPEGPAAFPTARFDTREAIEEWFASD